MTHRPIAFVILLLLVLPTHTVFSQNNSSPLAQDAKTLLREAIAAVGGQDGMHALKDVRYLYNTSRGRSEERYIFDGEISWGKSTQEDGTERVQFFDGKEAFVYLNGEKTTEKKAIESAFFSRKTNYYWLTMIQKMGDPGLVYTYGGKRTVDGIEYDLVDVTFEDGVGVAKDRYLLYINPYTKLVDQFLFNVTAVGRQDPILMKYTYESFPGGVKFPVVRQSHAAANWEGDLAPDGKWGVRWFTDFSFNNGYTPESLKAQVQ
ncbi:hypothetical protein CEQ90_09100 [Lewinellaceae bacterium SD302]|nr:hypothetical protein CEQ90_09100 [Lewinellaceae bacterium SD302]